MSGREGYHWRRTGWQPTAAQRRVLDGVASGETNATIAARLGLTIETVKWHVGSLLAETGCANRQALGQWWQEQRARPPRRMPLFGLLSHPMLSAVPVVVVGVALATMLLLAGRAGTRSRPLATATSAGAVAPTPAPASLPVTGGLYGVGQFIRTATGAVRAEHRGVTAVVHLDVGDMVAYPPGMQWEAPHGWGLSTPLWLAASATVAGQKLYLIVFTDGGGAQFERIDDRTFRTAVAGAAMMWVEDAARDEHRVAVDASGRLYLDPAPVGGGVVAIYGSGEELDVSGLAVLGRLAPVRRLQPPTEWFFNICENGRCGLSYRVGPLIAPFAATVHCAGGPEFDLDAGAVRLLFRDAGTLRDNPTWPGPDPTPCQRTRTVQAGETITESFVHYIVTAVSREGEPLSVVVAYDGTLYAGRLAVSASCPPCRGN